MTGLSREITIRKVDGKTSKKQVLTVHKKTFGMQLRRFELMEAAEHDPPAEGQGLAAVLRTHFHRSTYPSLAACTTGGWIPTEADCLDTILDEELEAWLDAVRELNPDWLPVPGETQEQAEKNL